MYDPRNPPLMECGHTANSTHNLPDGTSEPACVICAGLDAGAYIVALKPSLEGRKACCGYARGRDGLPHKPDIDSNWGLPFFKHRPDKKTDSYYCGCWGWD